MRSSYNSFVAADADIATAKQIHPYKSETKWETCNVLLPNSKRMQVNNSSNSSNTLLGDGTPITLQEIYYITKCADSIRSSLLNLFVTSTFFDLKSTF